MTEAIPSQPTSEARSLHLAHLATTHRTPLVSRAPGRARTRASAFTPMARHRAPAGAPPHVVPAPCDGLAVAE